MQKAIEGRPQRHVFSPVAWREDRTAEAQEDGCFPSAGSRQILSEPPKERSRQNTPDKQELWCGQEIKDEAGGRPGTQAPFRSAGSRAGPLSGPAGSDDRGLLLSLLKGRIYVRGKRGLCCVKSACQTKIFAS